MSDIIIDNWTLQRAAVSINDTYEHLSTPNEEYVRLVEAVILWDNVYFLNNEFSGVWKDILWRFGYQNYLTPFLAGSLDDEDYGVNEQHTTNNDIVLEGAIKYSNFCNKHHVAYLPSRERAECLKRCNFIEEYINRKDVMNFLDKTIIDYYTSLNERFGVNKIRFSFPVLFDFVAANTTDNFFLKTALQIRTEKEVIQFRKWLSDLEQNLQRGNFLELEKLLAYLPGLINDLTKITSPKRMAELQLGLSPGINIPIAVGGSTKHLVHADFLRTLSTFAINERKHYQAFNNIYN